MIAEALPLLTALRSLRLPNNTLGDDGVVPIAGALPHVGGPLEQLVLSDNDIGTLGFHALGKALVVGQYKSNAAASLTELDLRNNK